MGNATDVTKRTKLNSMQQWLKKQDSTPLVYCRSMLSDNISRRISPRLTTRTTDKESRSTKLGAMANYQRASHPIGTVRRQRRQVSYRRLSWDDWPTLVMKIEWPTGYRERPDRKWSRTVHVNAGVSSQLRWAHLTSMMLIWHHFTHGERNRHDNNNNKNEFNATLIEETSFYTSCSWQECCMWQQWTKSEPEALS